MTWRVGLLATSLTAAGVLAAACGGGSSSSTTASSAPTTANTTPGPQAVIAQLNGAGVPTCQLQPPGGNTGDISGSYAKYEYFFQSDCSNPGGVIPLVISLYHSPSQASSGLSGIRNSLDLSAWTLGSLGVSLGTSATPDQEATVTKTMRSMGAHQLYGS
jgi:hypothetical protein